MDSKVLENGEGYQPYDYLYAKGHKVGQAFGLEAVGYFRDEEDIRRVLFRRSLRYVRVT